MYSDWLFLKALAIMIVRHRQDVPKLRNLCAQLDFAKRLIKNYRKSEN